MYGCSFGALKLCERCTVNRYTVSIFLCYRDILGIAYIVLGARPISDASRYSGASPKFAEIIPEIVNLGDHLGRSGYCPVLGRLPVPCGTNRMSAGWLMGWSVGAFI